MTLPKKNSRSIEVDAVRYRYVISRSKACNNGLFALNLTVQIESGRGCILKAQGMHTRDFWLDFPEVQSSGKYITMTSGGVAAVIRRAHAAGWAPGDIGLPFLFAIR